jgi:sortase A
MKRKILGTAFVVLGAVLIIIALSTVIINLWQEEMSGLNADHAMEQLWEQMTVDPVPATPDTPDTPALLPENGSTSDAPEFRPMPEIQVDGISYVGYLSIPALNLELPVISESTEQNLEIAPCRFFGTVYQKDFVIGGHRYRRHFRKLSTLGYGERLSFTDVEGNVYIYEVAECEVLEPNQAEYLCSGDWDLSLFTCTPGGMTRVVLRCLRVKG